MDSPKEDGRCLAQNTLRDTSLQREPGGKARSDVAGTVAGGAGIRDVQMNSLSLLRWAQDSDKQVRRRRASLPGGQRSPATRMSVSKVVGLQQSQELG